MRKNVALIDLKLQCVNMTFLCGPSLVSRAGDAGSTENKREGTKILS